MDKRTFLRQSVILAAGAPLLSLACGHGGENSSGETNEQAVDTNANKPLPYLETLGLQVWTVRDQMAADERLTLQTLKEIGYHQVELTDTRDLLRLKPLCDEIGLAINSCHIRPSTITGRWDLDPNETPFSFEDVMDQAEAAGLSHLVLAYLRDEERGNLDDYRRLSDQLNEAGAQAQARGFTLGYHNHNFEFAPMEGTSGFAVMMDRLDPTAVTFELDVFWAEIAGKNPLMVMRSLGDRLSLLHLKDLKATTPNTVSLDGIADDAFQEIGDGRIDMKAVMRLGEELGVDHCFVEQDRSPDPLASTRQSFEYLHA